MVWYKVNQRWWVDLTQARAFGKPRNSSDTLIIQWKDGQEEHFGVDDADKELIKLEEFVQRMFDPMKVITITPEEGELPFGMV
jgi:hypothetical protein